ncbi:MAG: F0F1 ATP synthase subunit B [bacterium]|nr:F0F1 ATP synthase subunit B [bacterium]
MARRVALVALLASSLMLALPSLAFASEGGGISLLIPNLYEFIPMVIAFILVWIILAKYALPVIFGMEDKRRNKIKGDLQSAEDSMVEALKLVEQREAELGSAKDEAAKIISDARKTSESTAAQIRQDAQDEAQSIIARAHSTIELDEKNALRELQATAAELSIAVASRLIGEDLNDEQHRAIIERYVAEAGSFNGD